MELHDVRKGRGRPPTPNDQRRSERVEIYLTPAERERMKRAAIVNRQSFSGFVRDVLVDGICETLGEDDA
jgi:hypothetical protein